MSRARKGTGITAREATVHEPGNTEGLRDSLEAVVTAREEAGGDFAFISREARNVVAAILAEADRPEAAPEDSLVWFAREIQFDLQLADRFTEDNDADKAARFAFAAASRWATMVMKFSWEVDALRGEKVAGGARNSAHQTNSRHRDLRQRRFERMRHHMATGLGVENAANACEAEGLGNAGAIKRQWDRHREKRDT